MKNIFGCARSKALRRGYLPVRESPCTVGAQGWAKLKPLLANGLRFSRRALYRNDPAEQEFPHSGVLARSAWRVLKSPRARRRRRGR